MTEAKKTTAKKAAASKDPAKSVDLATSGRDSTMAIEDAQAKVSDLRQAQADAATGGSTGAMSHVMKGETTSVLNPAFYPEAPEEESADAKGSKKDSKDS